MKVEERHESIMQALKELQTEIKSSRSSLKLNHWKILWTSALVGSLVLFGYVLISIH